MLLALLIPGCAPVGEAVVTSGWGYSWELLSHRIGYLRAAVNQDTSLDLGLIGGDWSTGETGSDTPSYRMRYQTVRAMGVAFAEGTVTLDVGPDGEAEASLHVPDAPEGRHLTAVLQGFALDCDVPQPDDYPDDYPARYGYTSAGFGFALGEPVASADGGVDVPVRATVRWAPQDRDDMNAAIPHALTRVEVRALVIGSMRPPDSLELEGGAEYPYEPPYTEQPPMELVASAESPGAAGFIGWSAWTLDGNLTGPAAGEGDYIRAMGVEAAPGADAPGRFDAAVTATFSNSSVIELTQFTAGFSGTLVRVGASAAEVEHHLVQGSHPVGVATTPPTLAE